MHELSLAENAVALIEDAARREGFTRARVIRLEVGALSCVDPQALRFALESATRGSCAEGARIEILDQPGAGECPACGRRCTMETLYELCQDCGSPLEARQGTAMRIKDLEVE
ncbi:MAG: hydrogenase maturation nickel metallochaperone HypA [Pseudomonadota bacterium]|jgi:hydrogenase nickel incorporation protein HypA/HybF